MSDSKTGPASFAGRVAVGNLGSWISRSRTNWRRTGCSRSYGYV